jgi:hypothetical protein
MIVAAGLRPGTVNRAPSVVQKRTLDVAPHPLALAGIPESRDIRARLRVNARLLFDRERALDEIHDAEDLDGANVDAEIAAPCAAGTAGERTDIRRGSNPQVVSLLRIL